MARTVHYRERAGTKGEAMNWDHLEANWKEFAGSARAHWGKLTDDDWKTITGKKEQLTARIQHRYGIAKNEAEKQVEEWSGALPDFVLVSKAR
jgi:uncharacterized protein YjbJ (UPF0337 family)